MVDTDALAMLNDMAPSPVATKAQSRYEKEVNLCSTMSSLTVQLVKLEFACTVIPNAKLYIPLLTAITAVPTQIPMAKQIIINARQKEQRRVQALMQGVNATARQARIAVMSQFPIEIMFVW